MSAADIVLALAELAETATEDFTVDDLLHELCAVAARALDVDGAGVMIAEGDSIRFIHASPERVVDVETLQEVLQRGPCQDSMLAGRAIVVEDITTSGRWPEFTDASAAAGLRAAVAMPLMARGEAWGALDVYRDTTWSWTDDEISLVRLFAGVAASYLVMASDRALAGAARRDLEHEATHDDLTGLPGRRLLFTQLEHALASARRRETVVAVLFVDLDHFKAVNDALGHAAGDAVLVETANRLGRALRDTDMVARLAGDEFVLVCEDLPGDLAVVDRHLEALGHRLEGALSRPIEVAGEEVVVSASIGVAVSSPESSTEDLLGSADTAMYAAKQRGHGRLVMGGRHLDRSVDSRHSLQRDLEVALERDELRVYFQPIVTPDPTHCVAAAEALLRWEHPELGLLEAKSFIGFAERSGSIGDIGRWMIDRACAQVAEWQHELGDLAPRTVFVNLSPREIADPALDTVVATALAAHGVPANSLGMEIVENAFVDSLLLPRLAQHNERGHPIGVDDFGTGYSSLSRLVDFPVQYAKIDRSFVADLPGNPRRRSLIETIVVIAHRLGLDVIAEGVETQEQVIDLTAAGCDLLQGYHLGHPQPADVLTAQWAAARPET